MDMETPRPVKAARAPEADDEAEFVNERAVRRDGARYPEADDEAEFVNERAARRRPAFHGGEANDAAETANEWAAVRGAGRRTHTLPSPLKGEGNARDLQPVDDVFKA